MKINNIMIQLYIYKKKRVLGWIIYLRSKILNFVIFIDNKVNTYYFNPIKVGTLIFTLRWSTQYIIFLQLNYKIKIWSKYNINIYIYINLVFYLFIENSCIHHQPIGVHLLHQIHNLMFLGLKFKILNFHH